MATGYDERYARQLHEQSLESEILRGISQFPTDSIRNDPDAFLAWQLQNQEFEGRKEENSIPLSMVNSVSSPTHKKHERKRDKNVNQMGGGGDEKHPLIIIDSDDSDTECDAPTVCKMDTDDRYVDNGRRSPIDTEESRQCRNQNSEDMMDSMYHSVTDSGSLLAQPQSDDVDSSGHSTFTFYSDDVEDDSNGEVSHYDEDVSSPQYVGFPMQPFSTWPKRVNGSPSYQHGPSPMKGSRRHRKWPKKQNNHYESSSSFIHNDSESDNGRISVSSSDDETQSKRVVLDTPDHIPHRQEKNYRRAQKPFQKSSDTVNDELVARRLGRELNRTQVEQDGEMARRMQEEEDEKNNLMRAERNNPFLDRARQQQMQQRSPPHLPHLQMHDPYANRVIRHRTPFQLHGFPEGLILLQSILGMEGQILPPHLMQNNIDLSDYDALWELAERIGDAKGSGISDEALQSLSTMKFQASTADSNDVNECRICMSDFSDGETITTLPCNHRYHKDCIEKWLKRKAECPICRENIHKEN